MDLEDIKLQWLSQILLVPVHNQGLEKPNSETDSAQTIESFKFKISKLNQ